MKSRRFMRSFDWVMFCAVLVLLVLSSLFIYSAACRNADHAMGGLAGRQFMWSLIGLGCYTAAALFDYRKLTVAHWWIYAAALVSLVLVLVLGMSVYGAHRWFSFGSMTVQPSEFAKLAVIFTLAALLGNPASDVESFKTSALVSVLSLIPFGLIAIEPDLGSAMILVPITVLILFCAGFPLRPLLTLAGVGIIALIILALWLRLSPDSCPFLTEYQKNRILVYLNFDSDPLGSGWNKLQSQIAVGSGGWFGKGYLNGTQNILGFLPRTVAPTDFIYSVVAEESGFFGSSLLVVLYGVVILRCINAAVYAGDTFGRLLAAGISVLIFSHVFINIAMTIGLMPITGVPLPLMSYGGTFMISIMTALGLVQSICLRRRI